MASLWPSSLLALQTILLVAVIAWAISVMRGNVSFVDSLWSLFFLIALGVYWIDTPGSDARAILVTAVVAAWALRLSVHITVRNWGEPEDHRYQAMRENNSPGFALKSLYLVFGLQGVLAWVISAPLLVAVRGPAPLGVFDGLAIIVWITGFIFEAVGDYQLVRFRADTRNKGQVLRSGLWRYTRHPNYFGEACIWWAFYLFAISAGGWWTVFAPILMTVLLLKVSGVALLEKDINQRRPGYAEYVRNTNAFFPWLPRSGPPRTKEA